MASEPATKADMENILVLIQQLTERLDQRFDAMGQRFEAMDRRFEAIESRLDRISDTLVSVQSQMAAMTRWSDRQDREFSSLLSTQEAQRRAIDSLVARVARLEQQRHN